MKNYIKLIVFPVALLLANCTSGQNSPADSHPGSGSVKAGRSDKAATQRDTSKADSLTKEGEAQK